MSKPLKILSEIPVKGQGSFWENRGDRFHCGIDLYSEKGEQIYALNDGLVVAVEIMTHPDKAHYWNITYQVVVKSDTYYIKYGEVINPTVIVGDYIRKGQAVASVGQVLDAGKIKKSDPEYIQKLKYGKNAMLHLECWKKDPVIVHDKYLGGNWFDIHKPINLMNPLFLLRNLD